MAKSKFGALIALAMIMVAGIAATVVHAAVGTPLPINLTEVKVNGDTLTEAETTRTSVDRDGTLDVTVKLQSQINATLENVEVTAFLVGYEYNDNSDERLSQTTEPFSVDSDVVYSKKLSLKLPQLMEQDNYKLRVIVADRYGAAQIYNYNLKVDSQKHNIGIRDVIFSPDGEVQSGRALLSVVRIKNFGTVDEQGIKVKVAIPELGVSASQYIDELAGEKSISSEELYMRIPVCAKEGSYDIETTVTYDEGHGKVTKKDRIMVVEDGACALGGSKVTPTQPTQPTQPSTPVDTTPKEDKVVVSVGPDTQSVNKGEGGAIYQVALANEGSAAKTYVLSTEGADSWAVTRMSPSAIVTLNAGEQKTVYIYVTAKESAASGTHMFSVSLKQGDKLVKQFPLSAEVADAPAKDDALRSGLEMGFVALLVLLVIVALIVGFNKLRGKKEDQEMTQTYY